jgi:hypothetical protein
MIPLWKGKNPIYFGVIRSKVKVTYYKYNFWQQGCFRTITLVLYIGFLTNYYHIESFQTPYDTSGNVCRDIQN